MKILLSVCTSSVFLQLVHVPHFQLIQCAYHGVSCIVSTFDCHLYFYALFLYFDNNVPGYDEFLAKEEHHISVEFLK
ncbi:hypothetical protein JOD18_002578 [Gracilibacillus alcaliphilus]|nr:hypothetical protein [Gracilibacillus alcaliphilus]